MDPIIRQLIKEIHPAGLPATLYHYANQSGLMGIFNSRSVWASNILYLNDSKEYRQTVELANELLMKKAQKQLTFLLAAIPASVRLGALDGKKTFVASFSEHKDQLSQWRGYCGNSLGFSIGFAAERLEIAAERSGFALLPCIYDKVKQEELIDKIFRIAIERFGKTKDHVEPLNWFVMNIAKIAPILKNPSFSEEAEWRLVSNREPFDEVIEFRDGRTMMIPYTTIGLVNEGVRDDKSSDQRKQRISEEMTQMFNSIVIGPNPHMDLALNSAEQFVLKKHHVRVGKFLRSAIPYRAW